MSILLVYETIFPYLSRHRLSWEEQSDAANAFKLKKEINNNNSKIYLTIYGNHDSIQSMRKEVFKERRNAYANEQ